ncbi:MAG: NUDIX hydrolase [Flavobacteriales bacterium]|nr:NUDIX hydrolase [Flavobacteriales bacterium]
MSKINVSVDCVIFGFDDIEKKLKVLTIEKKVDPFSKKNKKRTQFAIPGDLIELEEDIDAAASRVLFSLTKLNKLYLKQFKTFGHPKRVQQEKDKEWLENFRSHPDERVITIAYASIVKMEDYNPEASYFAHDVKWTNIDEIPELAFDHNQIVNEAVIFLRNEINHEVTSELLPRKFTLSQLQELYEIILNEKLDKRNFRKQIMSKGVVEKTNEKQKGVSHKPAELYKFNQQ